MLIQHVTRCQEFKSYRDKMDEYEEQKIHEEVRELFNQYVEKLSNNKDNQN